MSISQERLNYMIVVMVVVVVMIMMIMITMICPLQLCSKHREKGKLLHQFIKDITIVRLIDVFSR